MAKKAKKPDYILDLEIKVEHLTDAYRELRDNQDNLLISQAEFLSSQRESSSSIRDIRACLLGDEFSNPCDGGFIKQFGVMRCDVNSLIRWRERATLVSGILYTIMTSALAFFSAVIIRNWDKLFGGG